MWLLSTDRAQLRFFASAGDAQKEGYVILSHVWDQSGEQTFQETQALCARCAKDGTNPRDLSSDKVRQSCQLAEGQGYRWIWNDTCCIDKTSSSELSEAINSMFTYYALADICFAYLRDVPSSCIPDERLEGTFRESIWFTRGWTLQELIAPADVVFLSGDWKVLGRKWDISAALQLITGVPSSVLRMEKPVESFSIAQRMSWAAARTTTREEDMAYCLMGLFNINMPTLYGEGSRAFQRLQEEILSRDIDTSLFSWNWRPGGSIPTLDSQSFPILSKSTCHCRDRSEALEERTVYLFARSPRDFSPCAEHKFNLETMVELGLSANLDVVSVIMQSHR